MSSQLNLFLVDAAPRPLLPDADPRLHALDVHHSWIVEAPAGSGKTGLLIQRFLKLLADPSVETPEQVLAITFTTKATAEMRERVLAQLQAAGGNVPSEGPFDLATRPFAEAVLARDRLLGWSLAENPRRLNIRTIDSVCSEIANALPILSGSGGRRSPVDDPAPLYALAARRTFLELGGSDPLLHDALSTILLHRDGNLAHCESLLSGMLHMREQWGQLVPLGRDRLDDAWLDANILPRLERDLDLAICAALSQLAQTIPPDLLDRLSAAAEEMAHLDGYKGDPSPIAICSGRHGSPQALSEDLEHWQALIKLLVTKDIKWRKRFSKSDVKVDLSKADSAALSAIVDSLRQHEQLLGLIEKFDSLPPVKYPAEQWRVAKALFRVLNRALVELQLVFAERGQCDFTELALAARTALASGDGHSEPAIETALGVRLQHLLVDEMQDTSSIQYELIQALISGWDGHSQTVFLVGDPKQSIYLFRQARVERFIRIMHSGQIGDLPLGVLRLTANFRSQSALVDDLNADFPLIFPGVANPLHPEDVPYTPASATISRNPAAASRVWHTNILPYDADREQTARNTRRQRRADAMNVCEIVESWRARSIPPNRTESWKIAVLCRSRNHLDEIVAAFKSDAIPFRAVDIDLLKERPEVQDLIALTRALMHPADRVAWLAILRAPWCGLTLAEIHSLAGADDHAFAERSFVQVIAERGHLLPDESCRRLERLWPVLEAALESRGRLSLAQLVERSWRSLGGDAYLGPDGLANSTRYLQLLDQIETESPNGAFDLPTLERRLDKLFAAPSLQTDAVDLLTIHKAKGLEWDVVIVPALERIAARDRGRFLNWIEFDSSDEDAAHFLLAPIAGKGEASEDLNNWINSVRRAREAAERKRLFYVACTRAREELHLFAAPSRAVSGWIGPKATSLLATAWPAAGPWFTPGAAAAITFEDEEQPLDIAAAADANEPDGLDDADRSEDQLELNGKEELALAFIPLDDRSSPLKRLPLDFDPATQLRNLAPLSYGDREDTVAAPHFARPEGSLAARAFGNAVHAFLEKIAVRLGANETPSKLIAELFEWTPRISAALRSEGLAPAVVERLTQRVLFALESTLKDFTGLWLLSSHAGAANEYALTAWESQYGTIRIDRIFHAGPAPLSTGSSHFWVVDYKTTTHGVEGLEAFLAAERLKYASQLEAYAAVVTRTEARALRLALYYPMLARLIWWPWQK